MTTSLLTLLRTLSGRDVDYIVVGGLAGVLHGAPVVTADLDIVHSRAASNVARLLTVLENSKTATWSCHPACAQGVRPIYWPYS
jgi:hypothetical protein